MTDTAAHDQPAKPKRRKHIRTPRILIVVTQDDIDRAKQADSRTCMVAEAIKSKYPWATNVEVDFHSIKLSDPKRNVRYCYQVPRTVAMALLAFDQGLDVRPFSVRTVHATHLTRSARGGRSKKEAVSSTPVSSTPSKAAIHARMRRVRIQAARPQPDHNGDWLPPAEYVNELVKRVDDPTADLGPAVAVEPFQRTYQQVKRPTMVGGKLPRTSLKPGQFRTTRRFGAREFWPGDGSGLAGVPKDDQPSDAQ